MAYNESDDTVHHGFKKLSQANWIEPDIPISFPGVTESDWTARVLEPQLVDAVPENVRELFEVARGSVLYGWFFYPLQTLAAEQLDRVMETAARERCKMAGIPVTQIQTRRGKSFERNLTFAKLIGSLNRGQIIPNSDLKGWDATRHLRNYSSHPKKQSILPPGFSLNSIELTARRINQLYAENPNYFSLMGDRVRRNTGIDQERDLPVVVGVDVGGSEKGFHLVALENRALKDTLHTRDPVIAAKWCNQQGAVLVGVDAPSGWSIGGEYESRQAERELSQFYRISSYATQSRKVAATMESRKWVFNGERFYSELNRTHPIYQGQSVVPTPSCFESFPHAAACALTNEHLFAKDKARDRRNILRAAGIDPDPLRNQDYVDASICALVAYSVHIDYFLALGNKEEGFIVTPPLH